MLEKLYVELAMGMIIQIIHIKWLKYYVTCLGDEFYGV